MVLPRLRRHLLKSAVSCVLWRVARGDPSWLVVARGRVLRVCALVLRGRAFVSLSGECCVCVCSSLLAMQSFARKSGGLSRRCAPAVGGYSLANTWLHKPCQGSLPKTHRVVTSSTAGPITSRFGVVVILANISEPGRTSRSKVPNGAWLKLKRPSHTRVSSHKKPDQDDGNFVPPGQ